MQLKVLTKLGSRHRTVFEVLNDYVFQNIKVVQLSMAGQILFIRNFSQEEGCFCKRIQKGEIRTSLLGVTYEINTCAHKASNKGISIYFFTKQKPQEDTFLFFEFFPSYVSQRGEI